MWKSKYGAIKTVVDGITFASKREAAYYQELRLLRRAGEIVQLELQPRFELIPKPNRIVYVADFRILKADGTEEIIDVKGVETAVFKLKHKLFKHFYPDKKLVLVK